MSNVPIPFRCHIGSTDFSRKLDLEILLDGNRIFYTDHVAQPIDFNYDMADDEQEHLIEFVMTSKTYEDTGVDEQGNILWDAMLTISDFFLDEIDITHIFQHKSYYIHDFNGTQPELVDSFFDHMGCNGRIGFKFSSPFYIWLLENM